MLSWVEREKNFITSGPSLIQSSDLNKTTCVVAIFKTCCLYLYLCHYTNQLFVIE